MTINAPAALLLLLYELVAEEQGVSGGDLRGTVQNDVLKEYCARGNYIYPPRPTMRITTDLFAYCHERLPRFNTISISGYHIREAGSTAVQELAFTLANGIAYAQAAVDAGLSPDEFGERLSFFFNAHNHFFQEIAKFRAARRLWARIMKERFGATNTKALALRFHAQTGGSTLTAQQPENNIVRVAVQALSAVAGGAQSIHTNGFDEALALPTERSAKIALRTQQVLAHEAGGTDTADPFGGSYFIEALTTELEEAAWELIERVDEIGGSVAAIEQGFVQREIEDAAFRYQREVEAGRARHRRRQPLPGARARADRAATGSIRRPSGGSSSGRRASGPSGTPRPRRRRWRRYGAWRARTRTCCCRCGRRSTCGARWGDLRGPARGVRDVRRPAGVVRILLVSQMYPGPGDPDLGVFVQALEEELAGRGHELERAVLDSRAGGKARYLRLGARRSERRTQLPAGRRLRALSRPDRAAGRARLPRAARRDRSRTGRQEHRRLPRHSGRHALRRAPRRCRRRRLPLPPSRARDEGSRGPRQGRGRRLRRRPGAVPRRARARRPDRVPLRRVADRAEERRAPDARLRAGRRPAR